MTHSPLLPRTGAHHVVHSRPLLPYMLLALSQLPLLTLIIRATAPSWNFPHIIPVDVTDGASLSVNTSRLWSATAVSVSLALATGALAAVVGANIARGVMRVHTAIRRTAMVAMFFPVIAPPVALGVGVQVLLLRVGLGSTWTGVWLAHVIPAIGYVSLYFLGVLSLDDDTRAEAARTLGATRWQTWWFITVPLLRRRLVEAFVLGALVSWGQLAITLLVGGGVVRTMPVEILAIVRSGDDHMAAIASLLLAVPPLLALSVLKGGAAQTGASA